MDSNLTAKWTLDYGLLVSTVCLPYRNTTVLKISTFYVCMSVCLLLLLLPPRPPPPYTPVSLQQMSSFKPHYFWSYPNTENGYGSESKQKTRSGSSKMVDCQHLSGNSCRQAVYKCNVMYSFRSCRYDREGWCHVIRAGYGLHIQWLRSTPWRGLSSFTHNGLGFDQTGRYVYLPR